MRRSTIALVTLGACILVVVCVIAGMLAYLLGIRTVASSAFTSSSAQEEIINENLVVVEDSVEWKLISQSDEYGNESRVSFKFTLENPTSEDIQVNVYDLRIRFYDSDGFAACTLQLRRRDNRTGQWRIRLLGSARPCGRPRRASGLHRSPRGAIEIKVRKANI